LHYCLEGVGQRHTQGLSAWKKACAPQYGFTYGFEKRRKNRWTKCAGNPKAIGKRADTSQGEGVALCVGKSGTVCYEEDAGMMLGTRKYRGRACSNRKRKHI